MFIHQRTHWPRFHWDAAGLAASLASVRYQQGEFIGHMEDLGFNLQQEAVLHTLTADVLKSSEIEGEKLDAAQVRSSIARRLGMEVGALKSTDRNVDGVVEMVLDATRSYRRPLTDEHLFAWHAALFPTARSGMTRILTGAWRDDSAGPMQVISGPLGREHLHFEAPKAPVRRRQRTDRTRDLRHGSCPVRGQPAALLQHVGPSGTKRSDYNEILERTQKGLWTSHHGWTGSSAASAAPLKAPRRR